MGLTDDVTLALRAAPESFKDPSLALAAATAGGDPQQNAEVGAHAINTQVIGNAVNTVATHHGGHGVFGATLGWLGGGIKGALDVVGVGMQKGLELANKPLSEVQHEYRYLRDVEANHGFGAMLGQAIPMIAGGVAGGLLAGPSGAVLGAEAAGSLWDRNFSGYGNSWQRTNSPTYVDPHGGEPISPGRDAARFLGSLSKHLGVHIEQHKGFDLYDAVSGIGDGVFDIGADPLTQVGALRHQALSEQGARGVLRTFWSGTGLKSADLAVAAQQYPSVRRGLERLAGMSAEEVIAKSKKLAPFANEIGAANTWQEVGQVLQNNAAAAEMRLKTLPRQPLANVPFAALTEQLGARAQAASLAATPADAGLVERATTAVTRRVGETYKRVTTFVPTSYNEATQELSRTTFHLNDPDSPRTIYDMAKWGHNEDVARKVAADWSTATLPERQTIFRNLMTNNIVNRMDAVREGWSASAEGRDTIAQIADRIDGMFGDIDAGRTTPHGFDEEGRIISKMEQKGQTVSQPILEKARINIPMPDYMTFDRNLKALAGHGELYGAADDFLYRHFTQNVFKKWALASGGFALRVATGELIPAIARDASGLYKGKITQIMAEHGWQMEKGEEEHILAPIARFMASKADVTDSQIEALANMHKMNHGETVAPGAAARHSQGHEVIGTEEYVKDSLYNLKTEVPKKTRMTDDVEAWGPDHDDHWVFWQKQAQDLGTLSPATKAGADAYRSALAEGATKAEAAHRGSLAAKDVLDAHPEDLLNQNYRHFYATYDNKAVTGAGEGAIKEFAPGQKALPGVWGTVGEQPVGQFTVQRPLLTEKGNVIHAFREPGTLIGETGAVAGETVPRRQMLEPPKPAEPGTYTQVAPPVAGPHLLEQQQLFDIKDPHLDWAQVMMKNLEGTIYGADGTLHEEILHAIAEGRAPDTEFMKNVPMEQRPNKIMGAYEKPAAPDRLSDRLFNKLNGFINWMAREPIYQNAFLKEWDTFEPMVKEGTLTYDEAIVRSQNRAVKEVLPHIHNINERTLMAEHARNFIPFYFAQQQSYARLFRLLGTDPEAFRKVQLAYSKLADFGGIYSEDSGNQHFVIPGAGFLTGGAISAMGSLGIPVLSGTPAAFTGNLKSLASVSPFLEGGEIRPGPLVAIGVRAINNLFPETRSATDPIMGEMGSSQAFWEMLVPNTTARNLVKAFVATDDRTQIKSTLDAIQSMEYQQNIQMRKYKEKNPEPTPGTPEHDAWAAKAPHLVPGPDASDMERNDFIDRAKNHARIGTIFKAALGSVSPVSPSLQLGNLKVKSELYDQIKKVGITQAIQDLLDKDPDATPYTVFETDAQTASPIDSTHPAQQWVTQNLSFIKDRRYAAAASYFVPQTDDKFSQQVYNEQMAMGLRRTKAPDQLIKDIHVAEGNRWYFDVFKPAKDEALAQAKTAHERDAINRQFATAGSPDGKIQSLESMKLQNPLWYTNFSSGGRDNERQLALSQMKNIIDSGTAPDSPMTSKIAALLKDYDAHSAALLPGRTDAYAAAQRQQEKANWQRYLKKTADEEPDLAMVINNVFRGV